MKDVLTVILGGGRGTRLYPLTKYRSKPAVPLAGKYRLVDIPVSNSLNSGIRKIVILTQFNSESLNKHIFRTYKLDTFSDGFVDILAAEQSIEEASWFEGSADAVRKCFKHFRDPHVKYILILSGDQVYKMDFSRLINFHVQRKSDITIACNPVAKEETFDLGIMGIDDHFRIKSFIEKPGKDAQVDQLAVSFDGSQKYLASMGIYVFNKDVLFDLLINNKKADFGKEVIPDAIPVKKTHAFIHSGYWKDIGTIQSFYEENLAFTDQHPPLDLFDENWKFFTRPRYLPLAKIADSYIDRADVGEGAIIEKARIKHSIIGLRSTIGAGTVVEDSILLGSDFYDWHEDHPGKPVLGIGKNCVIKKAIIDKNVSIGDNVRLINQTNAQDLEGEYFVIRDGIIVVPKNTVIPPGTVI
jgi:glucose-1-phosphate adenylyltransferase